MGDIDRSRSLTQSELAAVLRRAAELDSESALPVPVEGLDPLVVEAAAIEAGLSPQAVRRALREVVHPDEHPPDAYDEGGLLPVRELVMVREVPGSTREVEDRVARFLRRQLFEQQRIFADGSRWAPRKGWVAGLRRDLDPGGRMVLNQVRSVSVSVSPVDAGDESGDGSGGGGGAGTDRVVIRLGLDLSSVRSIHTAWLAGGAVSGAAVLGATGVLVGLDPVAIAALPVAGGLAVGGHVVGRWSVRREVQDLHTAVAGLLDRLEHPDRDRPSLRSDGRRSEGRRTDGRGVER